MPLPLNIHKTIACCLLTALAASGTGVTLAAQASEGEIPAVQKPLSETARPNRFLALNPDHRERAGGFYENAYLPEAARKMVEAADDPRLDVAAASHILREVIYGFLDALIAGEGVTPFSRHQQVIRKADASVKAILGAGPAFQRYIAWRQSSDRYVNPLEFIMRPRFPVDLPLSEEMKAAGWQIRYLEGRDTIRFGGQLARQLSRQPLEVLMLQRQVPSRQKAKPAAPSKSPPAYLHLVIFRQDDFYKYVPRGPQDKPPWEMRNDKEQQSLVMKRIEILAQPQATVKLFWATTRFVIFLAEGKDHQAQEPVKLWIKHRLWRYSS